MAVFPCCHAQADGDPVLVVRKRSDGGRHRRHALFAMRLQAIMHYDPRMVGVSVGIAVVVAMIALWITFRFRNDTVTTWGLQKFGSVLLTGAAIPGL